MTDVRFSNYADRVWEKVMACTSPGEVLALLANQNAYVVAEMMRRYRRLQREVTA